jgi:hypothetical protein
MDNSDLEGNNHGGRTSTNKAPQAEAPFDALPVHKAAVGWQMGLLTGNSNPRYLYKF